MNESPPLIADIQYGEAGDEPLLLDVRPLHDGAAHPVVVIVHGGGWASGDKATDIDVLFEPMRAAGFVTVSVNYRLAPKHRWPACYDDVRAAIGWVKQHAAEYGGDPNRLAVLGYSAGGQLALQAAIADPACAAQAIVGIAPPTDMVLDQLRRGAMSKAMGDLLDRWTFDVETVSVLWDISPINHLHADLPPMLLVHGTEDASVPYVLSLHMKDRLAAFGVPCDLITLEGYPHNINTWAEHGDAWIGEVAAWLGRVLEAEAGAR